MRASDFIVETNLTPAQEFINAMYSEYPQTFQNNHVMPLGDEQFAMFELRPSMSRRGAVEVYWFQAYPLRTGVGSRAMQILQAKAQEYRVGLTLMPWDKGQVSKAALTKFYKKQGFKPHQKGSVSLGWEPQTLDETTEQDQILIHVADAATQRIIDLFAEKESNFLNAKITFDPSVFISRRDRLTWLSGLYLKALYLPEVSDPEINSMLARVKVRLSNHYSDKNKNTLGAYITYDDGSRMIELYLPRIQEIAKEAGHRTPNMIRSTLIHEMQHALDDIKSQGKFDNTPSRPSNSTADEKQQHLQYLKLPFEINARFTQAILDIALQYNKIEGPYRLQDLITNAFQNHNLNVASKREYKHLAARAYKFFDAMQNTPKRIEPKSLAQRAIAWITSKPTSAIK